MIGESRLGGADPCRIFMAQSADELQISSLSSYVMLETPQKRKNAKHLDFPLIWIVIIVMSNKFMRIQLFESKTSSRLGSWFIPKGGPSEELSYTKDPGLRTLWRLSDTVCGQKGACHALTTSLRLGLTRRRSRQCRRRHPAGSGPPPGVDPGQRAHPTRRHGHCLAVLPDLCARRRRTPALRRRLRVRRHECVELVEQDRRGRPTHPIWHPFLFPFRDDSMALRGKGLDQWTKEIASSIGRGVNNS